jgi:hypothetical protein
MIIFASFYPWYSLKKGQVNFGASKNLDRISGLSGRDHTLELSCGNLASIGSNPSRACAGPGEYGRKVPEFLNPKNAFDSEPACLSWLPPVVFVLVKESSDLTLQLSCVIQLTHGTRMFKKFALNFCGKIVPLHDDCGAEAPQNMLLFVSERCQFIAIFLRCLWSAALVIPAGDGLVLIWPARTLWFFSAHSSNMVCQTGRFHNVR